MVSLVGTISLDPSRLGRQQRQRRADNRRVQQSQQREHYKAIQIQQNNLQQERERFLREREIWIDPGQHPESAGAVTSSVNNNVYDHRYGLKPGDMPLGKSSYRHPQGARGGGETVVMEPCAARVLRHPL